MCGFLISFSSTEKNFQAEIFQAAAKFLDHRGPDGLSTQNINGTLVAHYRLAVQDLSNAAVQPLHSSCGLYCIIFNGEIFNFQELKETYLSEEIILKTSSDTEVLLELFVKFGVSCFAWLDGMFAGSIINKATKEVVHFRDNYGIKPYYFIKKDGYTVVSSEIKPLIYLFRDVEFTVRDKYLETYINHSGCDYGAHTLINEIGQLEAGCYAIDDPENQVRWYDLYDNVSKNDPTKFDQNKFEKNILRSIRNRLVSDIDVSITLSGGLDSTTIWSAINKKILSPIRAFTLKQVGTQFEERVNESDVVVSYTDGQVTPLEVGQISSYDEIRTSIYFQEFPSWSLSHVMYDEIYRRIRDAGYNVVIEGHGNDEVLGGYSVHFSAAVKSLVQQRKFYKAFQVAQLFFKSKGRASKLLSAILLAIYLIRIDDFIQLLRGSVLSKKSVFTVPFTPKEINTNSSLSHLQSVLLSDFQKYIIPTVLRVFDRSTMRSGVEMRPPFLNVAHVENSLNIADELRFSEDGQKSVLRQTEAWKLPDIVLDEKVKRGFSSDISVYCNIIQCKKFDKIIQTLSDTLPINFDNLDIQISKMPNLHWQEFQELNKLISLVIWYDLFIKKSFINE